MTYETLLVETRGAVTLVTLNRPQALNALNSKVLDDLIAAFAAYEADPGQRCAVLSGSGDKAFAAGADIKEMADKPAADFYLEDFFSKWTSDFVKKEPRMNPKMACRYLRNQSSFVRGNGSPPLTFRIVPS